MCGNCCFDDISALVMLVFDRLIDNFVGNDKTTCYEIKAF